jgi:hypothetical protein
MTDTPFTETHRLKAKPPSSRCDGCGHRADQHRQYTNHGVNRHGSRWVCIVDNCRWTECRFNGEAP